MPISASVGRYRHINILGPSIAYAIQNAIALDGFWGLVVVRCTYQSQEKWNMFIADLKERVVHSLNIKDAPYLNNQLKWTVFILQDSLEDADLQTSNKVFTDWLSGEGQTELAHVPDKPVSPSGDPFRAFPSSPRYLYYIHADAEVVESVVTDCAELDPPEADGEYDTTWRNGSNFLKIVAAYAVRIYQEEMKREIDENDLTDERTEAEDGDEFKNVRGGDLTEVYTSLMTNWEYAFWRLYDEDNVVYRLK